MRDIDLIPSDYHQIMDRRRSGRHYLILCALLICIIALGRIALAQRIGAEELRISQLKASEVRLLEQRSLLDQLQMKTTDLEARLEILDVLRGGYAAEQMFVLIDQAINPSAWFTLWSFVREGDVPNAKESDLSPGYFIIVPQEKKGYRKAPWQDSTHMRIRGQAVSHSDLAGFVQMLLSQPEIEDVHLLHTGTRSYSFGQVIEYELAVVLDSKAAAS